MRVILAAGICLIAVSVTGCDINTTPRQAKVECHCTNPPAPPAGMRGSDAYPPPPEDTGYRYRGHGRGHGHGSWHHRYADGGHSYYWRREYSEMSVFTYDYHSRSTSYTTGGHGGGYGGASAYAYAAAGAYAEAGAYAGAGAHGGGGGAYVGDMAHGGDDGYRVAPQGAIDGYDHDHHGRGHGGAYTGDPAHYETGDSHRGDVWHGYDVDCPDPARR